jgi:hypothetical protein
MAAGATLDPDDDAVQGAQAPAVGMPQPLAGASPSQPASPGAGATPTDQPAAQAADPSLAGPPAPQQPNAITNQPQPKKQISTGPPVKFDPDKLAKVQTASDLVDAMTPKSRTTYLDWWEKQHGDIDDKYDNMQKQLGQRPSDDQDLSRQEKFSALLQFGLHLMKASSAPTTNQGGVLAGQVSDSYDSMQKAHQDSIAASQKDYDTQSNAIESGRQADLKGIGTPATAMKAQQDSDTALTTQTKNNMTSLKTANDIVQGKQANLGPATYSTDEHGNLHSISRDPNTGAATAQPVLGIDGKPYQGRVLGRETGSGVDKGDPAAVKTQKYLMSLGYNEQDATSIAMKPKTGNVNQDHTAVFKTAMQANGGDSDSATHVADMYILNKYGAGALAQTNKPQVPQRGPYAPPAPPAQALQGLKPGMVRDFGPKGAWSLGLDGTPYLVRQPGGQSPNAIQNPPPQASP